MLTETISNQKVISPSAIMQTGLGFWSSKVLLTAVNIDLFSSLAEECKTAEEIQRQFGLQQRGLTDFLDALVSLNFLTREGKGSSAKYSNTPETAIFLDRKKSSYIGGILEMANNRLFTSWNYLEDALRTGLPQNEVRTGHTPLFETLYANEQRLEQFLSAMASVQKGNFIAFARQFDFFGYHKLCDIGGAGGELAIQVAMHQPDIKTITWDLPQAAPIAQRNIEAAGVQDRVKVQSGNFFEDTFPKADIITMGNILHDWNLEEKKMLIRKAYEALPVDGALVVIENIIDDERKQNTFGLLMSLNMLIETYGGFDYTAADFKDWANEAGFKSIDIMHLTGPSSALIAYK